MCHYKRLMFRHFFTSVTVVGNGCICIVNICYYKVLITLVFPRNSARTYTGVHFYLYTAIVTTAFDVFLRLAY